MKRIIVLLLSSIMILSVLALVSCSTNENVQGPQTTLENEGQYLPQLPPAIDLQGKTVTFVGHGAKNTVRHGLEGTFADENDGDLVRSAMHESVERVKSRFNVDIELITASASLVTAISSELMAGDDDYDVLVGYAFYDISLASKGYVLDINTLGEYGADGIIDTSASYWAGDYIDSASYKGKSFWLLGDISLETFGCMYVTYVNADLYKKVCYDKFGDIYGVVKKGEWTVDVLSEMSALGYTDVNGNDKADVEDGFGWATNWGDTVEGMCIAMGMEYSMKQEDGGVSLTVGTLPHNISVLEKLYALKSLSSSFTFADDAATTSAFIADRVMFTVNTLRVAEIDLREMQTNYYILPVPKYDASQKDYRTALHDQHAIFGISYASTSVYESAVVLEALCAEHSRTVRPSYYDVALKYKYTRDDGSAEMLDIVRDGVYTDFALAWANDLSKLTHAFRTLTPNPSSILKKNELTWSTKLAELVATLENA